MSTVLASSVYGVRELANWILDYGDHRGVPITNMALNKLVYFAYEHSLVRYGRKLTAAKIEAWDHGPVFREVYRAFKSFGNLPISSRASIYDPITNSVCIANSSIDDSDAKIIKEAIDDLIALPASVLRDLSHVHGGPWDKTWNHAGNVNPGMHIDDNLILHLGGKGVRVQ